MALRLRRGTDAERLLITPLEGELLYTTDTKKIYVGDGTTLGGIIFKSGSLSINELIDVNTTEGDSTQPQEGEALVWDSSNQVWRPGVVSGGAVDGVLDDLTDVNVTNPLADQILKYNSLSSAFENTSLVLDTISDVSITGIADEQILQYNQSTGLFVNVTPALSLLSDVSTFSPSSGDFLLHSGGSFSNVPFALNTFDNVSIGFLSSGDLLRYNGTRWTNAQGRLSELFDVRIDFGDSTSPGNGEALVWNADQSFWRPGTINLASDNNPILSSNLNLNNNNIQGSGNINVTGNIVGSLVTAPTINGVNLYGELQGSIRALDSSLVYDLITDTLAASTLNTNEISSNTIATNTISANDTAVLSIGSAASPTVLQSYSNDGDFIDFYGTVTSDSWITVNVSEGTLAAPTVNAPGDFLSGLIIKGYDGAIFSRSSVIAGGVDPNGTISSDIVPGIVYLINRDFTGGNTIASFDAAGTFTAPTIQPGVYADISARDTSISAPAEGMMVFLTSTQKMQVYVSDTGLAAGGPSNSTAGWFDMY